MNYSSLFTRSRTTSAPPPARFEGLDIDKAMYVAGLIANLINCAADTRSFRGAISTHPHITTTAAIFGSDEGARADYGLTAIATATRASITVAGADATRMGFLAFAPLHKQANGYEPAWHFDDPGVAMSARCRIIGLDLDVACARGPDGSGTITLTLRT